MTVSAMRGRALDAAVQRWAERHLHLRFQFMILISFNIRTRLGQMELGVCLGEMGSSLTPSPSGAWALPAYGLLGPQPVFLWRSVLKPACEPQLICQRGYFPLLGRGDVARRQSIADPGGLPHDFFHESPSLPADEAKPGSQPFRRFAAFLIIRFGLVIVELGVCLGEPGLAQPQIQ